MFNKHLDVPKYSRMVSVDEIEKNEFNLNLPRYIDSQQAEDLQDIEGHLKGGVPQADVDALQRYWDVCPKLRRSLFKVNRPGYLDLAVEKSAIKSTIYEHPEFAAFISRMNAHFATWKQKTAKSLRVLKSGFHPKELIGKLSEDMLAHYVGQPLIDKYDVYQHLMDYWAETMQDDCYSHRRRRLEGRNDPHHREGQEGQGKGQGLDLRSRAQTSHRRPLLRQGAGGHRAAHHRPEGVTARLTELEEEHGGEEGVFSELDKVNRAKQVASAEGDR
ncbi:MAG: N-6 DNA methylase [Nitrospira sp.]|nr:N-6 DNA methylase [Nitrospira sp.]